MAMARLYKILTDLKHDGKLSMMEGVAIAACCEHVAALPEEERKTLGTKVVPVVLELLKEAS